MLGSGSPTVHNGTAIVAGIGGEVSANAVADGSCSADSLAKLAPRSPLEELGIFWLILFTMVMLSMLLASLVFYMSLTL